jgi:glyoxylase-like metal-dependent hydrolase (beta-lactamase superfamily II)
MAAWSEIADRVFVRRYPFLDQDIGAVLGSELVLLVDTRTTARQADEIRRDLREVTSRPVGAVVNTHAHWDHCFGNRTFRPVPIWGHVRCAEALRRTGEAQRARVVRMYPDLADEVGEVEVDPPNRTFEDAVTLDLGDRTVELRHLGRGHTDSDIVVGVPGTGVLFAGDLVENGAPPSYGDAFPLEWPATVAALLELVAGAVVPGHGDVADRAFVERQLGEIGLVAELAREAHAGDRSLADAAGRHPWGAGPAAEAIERALAQLRGALDAD